MNRLKQFLEARGVPVYDVDEVPTGDRDRILPDGVVAMTVTVGDGRQAIVLGADAGIATLAHEAAHVLLRHTTRFPHSSPRDRDAYLSDPAETEAEVTARIALGQPAGDDMTGTIDAGLVTETIMTLQELLGGPEVCAA